MRKNPSLCRSERSWKVSLLPDTRAVYDTYSPGTHAEQGIRDFLSHILKRECSPEVYIPDSTWLCTRPHQVSTQQTGATFSFMTGIIPFNHDVAQIYKPGIIVRDWQFSLKLCRGSRGLHRPPGGVKGQRPLWGSGGKAPRRWKEIAISSLKMCIFWHLEHKKLFQKNLVRIK